MNTDIFNYWQTTTHRLLFCTLALALSAAPIAAQTEDDDE